MTAGVNKETVTQSGLRAEAERQNHAFAGAVICEQPSRNSPTCFYVITYDLTDLADRIATLASGEDADGTVVIAGYFEADKTISTESDFYGNGRIETFYTKEGNSYNEYDIGTRIDEIKADVVTWFENNSGLGYNNVYEALTGLDHSTDAFKDLVACYTPQA